MSRHDYADDGDLDDLALGRWRGAVRSAIRGKRGQAFLREMIDALDAMPEKRLIDSALITEDGEVCAMGCVLKKRGVDVAGVDPEESEVVAEITGLAEAMVREIAYENDSDFNWRETEAPEHRWTRMRAWAVRHLAAPRAESERA